MVSREPSGLPICRVLCPSHANYPHKLPSRWLINNLCFLVPDVPYGCVACNLLLFELATKLDGLTWLWPDILVRPLACWQVSPCAHCTVWAMSNSNILREILGTLEYHTLLRMWQLLLPPLPLQLLKESPSLKKRSQKLLCEYIIFHWFKFTAFAWMQYANKLRTECEQIMI